MNKMIKALNRSIYIWNMRVHLCRVMENVIVKRDEFFKEDCPLCAEASCTCSDCPIKIVKGTTCSWTPYREVNKSFSDGDPTGAVLLPLVQEEVRFLQDVKRKYKEVDK
jgi:hypothetical protein